MKRILIADCKQEISSFNPLPSHYENFLIHHGEGLYVQRGQNQELGGALAVFEARPDIEIVPTICAGDIIDTSIVPPCMAEATCCSPPKTPLAKILTLIFPPLCLLTTSTNFCAPKPCG